MPKGANFLKLTPLGNRLLVQVIEVKETEAPIQLKLFLPEEKDSYGMPREGRIVAVGNGEACARMDFKVDDRVFFSKYPGQRLKVDPRLHAELAEIFKEDAVYLFLNTKDIYGRTYESEKNS